VAGRRTIARVGPRLACGHPAGIAQVVQPSVIRSLSSRTNWHASIRASCTLHWNDRAHFLATMAQQMRRILVDYARARNALKGPGAQVRVELGDVASLHPSQPIDLLAIDQALTHLAAIDPRASRVVELRFFGGLVETETAEVLGISVASVKRDWVFARAWLLDRLETPFRTVP
jgi:RNA polymerase sigma factor (TIGR02999 family)